MKLLVVTLIVLSVALCFAAPSRCSGTDLDEFLGKSLREIETVKPGMTRADLLKTFKPEGGFSAGTRLKGMFVYRDSAYIKVDVEFTSTAGNDNTPPDPGDVITSISRPYLSYPVYD